MSYIDNLDPDRVSFICGILGILSTNTFFSMNTTINYLTIPAVLLGQRPDHKAQSAKGFLVSSTSSPASPTSHLNRQWQEIFFRGHRVGPASAILSGVTLSMASYFSQSQPSQMFFAAAAASAAVVMPYTLVVMWPTNTELHRRGDAITDGVDAKKEYDEEGTKKLLKDWVRMSKVRANMALVATVLAVAGLLL